MRDHTKKPNETMSNKKQTAKWAASVNDTAVFSPRKIITIELLKDLAGIPVSHILIRDHVTSVDKVFEDGDTIDLAEGNVFNSREKCNYVNKEGCLGKPKLAWFVDDNFEITTIPEQNEDKLKRLFNLDEKIDLLRDHKSTSDEPFGAQDSILYVDGPVLTTHFDLMKHCNAQCITPEVRTYKIKIQKEKYTVHKAILSGREILTLSSHDPGNYMLNQKINGKFVPIGLDDLVDLTKCGVERFTTLPNEQTEGSSSSTHQFQLPEEDQDLLSSLENKWETVIDQSGRWVIIHDIFLPNIYVQRETSIAIQIPSGYPTAALDMGYFSPPIVRIDQAVIPRTEASISIRSASWQRWSRHYTANNPWQPGEYNVFTHFLISQSWLEREVNRSQNVA